MKVALFSDVHGNITGLKAVLAHLERLGGADVLIAAGDIIGGGPGAEDLVDILIERKVRMVRGDNEELLGNIQATIHLVPDKWRKLTYETNEWLHAHLSQPYCNLLTSLPLDETLEFRHGQSVFVCHAAPKDPWAEVCAADQTAPRLRSIYGNLQADVVAYGHAHNHHALWLDTKLLLNVASVGLRKDGLSALTLLEYIDEHWIVQQYQVPYDVGEEKRLIRERNVPCP